MKRMIMFVMMFMIIYISPVNAFNPLQALPIAKGILDEVIRAGETPKTFGVVSEEQKEKDAQEKIKADERREREYQAEKQAELDAIAYSESLDNNLELVFENIPNDVDWNGITIGSNFSKSNKIMKNKSMDLLNVIGFDPIYKLERKYQSYPLDYKLRCDKFYKKNNGMSFIAGKENVKFISLHPHDVYNWLDIFESDARNTYIVYNTIIEKLGLTLEQSKMIREKGKDTIYYIIKDYKRNYAIMVSFNSVVMFELNKHNKNIF